jgi:anti-anti-sigma factor
VQGSDQYADIARHAENQPPAGIVVLRVEAGIYFANADAVRARVAGAAAEPGVYAVVLDAETIPFIDVTAARVIAALADDLRRRNVDLLITRDIGQVRDLLDREAPDPALHRVYPTVQAAVDAATAARRVPA